MAEKITDPGGNNVRAYFESRELDPHVTSKTLGVPHVKASPDALLDATHKLLAVSRQEVEPDDRDSLLYQTIATPADMLENKLAKDQGGVARKLLWKATSKPDSLDKVPTALLDAHVDSLFTSSGVSQALEENNAIEHFDQAYRVVRTGEGAIASLDAVPDSARSVQPSYAGFIDLIRGPESSKIGVDARMARRVRLGPDGLMYTQVLDLKTNKPTWVNSHDLPSSVFTMPGEIKPDDKFAYAMKDGRIAIVPKEEVRYQLISGDDMFSHISQLTPMLSGVKGMRLLMGSKYATAAQPLVNREAPLVRNTMHNGEDVAKFLGKQAGALFADVDGMVEKVDNETITVKTADGQTKTYELYDNLPFSRKTYLTNVPNVKPGQAVKAGQCLAGSNYTDKDGNLAHGTNLKVLYLPAKGEVFEDSTIVSESAARKKLLSEHMYNEGVDIDDNTKLGKRQFMELFPGKYTPEQLSKLDENGVVKPGAVLNPGDPVMLGVSVTAPGPGNLGRGFTRQFVKTWDHDHPGAVSYAQPTKTGFNIYARTQSAFEVGDKLSGAFGFKGIAARIVPDDKMYKDANGEPYDVVFSPLGIVSRTNSAAVSVAALGRVAKKTGKPYVLPSGFSDEDLNEIAERELAAHGLPLTEDAFDPETGRKIPSIGSGYLHIMKMPQMAESKGKARATARYTMDDQPARGGDGGNSKHYGQMEWDALFGYNAHEIIKDMKLVKGQRNDDFIRQFKLGKTPPMPGTPLVYTKFRDMVRAAGVHLEDTPDGGNRVFAMTDEQAKALTGNNKLSNADTFAVNSYKPLPGGLFDPEATDFNNTGTRWAYYELPEPLPNPLMRGPLRTLLGMTQQKFDDVVTGKEAVDGRRGSEALKYLLGKLDPQQVMDKAREEFENGPKSKRDDAMKRYKFASAMQRNGVKPSDFLMSRVPVLPPKYRPILKSGDRHMVNDMNYLYKQLHDASQDYKEAAASDLPDEMKQEARQALWSAYQSVVGTTEPEDEKLANKNIGGVLDQLLGKGSPKHSFVRRKVMESNLDIAALGAISLDPTLKLNEIGVPEEQAWTMYEPFVIRRLVQRGVPASRAVAMVQKREPAASEMLDAEMEARPVIINRAPSLHKYSVLAMHAKRRPGHAIRTPPGICTPLSADYDGDTISISVPVSSEAVREAREKMLPEKNLISVANDKLQFYPKQEYAMGGFILRKNPEDGAMPKRFKSWEEAEAAERAGKIDIDTPVVIG